MDLNGFRKTKRRGSIQRYRCTSCGKAFVENGGFRWKHHAKRTMIGSIHLHLIGSSLRDAAKFLSVSRWFVEYGKMIIGYAKDIKPFRTERLHMDEMSVKMRGKSFYVWASICRGSRFATAFLASDRTKKNARLLMKESPPAMNITTDGAFGYGSVIKDLKGLGYHHDHYHRCASFEDKKDNDPMERRDDPYRANTHELRGFKELYTGDLFVRLWTFYYDFIRPHSSLGRTPAEEAGLVRYYKGDDWFGRWERWVERASLSFYLAYISTVFSNSARFRRHSWSIHTKSDPAIVL